MSTLLLHLDLGKALWELFESDGPLEKYKHLLPSIILAWDKEKVPVDSVSSYIFELAFPFKKMNSEMTLWDSLVRIVWVAIAQIYKLGLLADRLHTYKSLTELRKAATHHLSFPKIVHFIRHFFRDLAETIASHSDSAVAIEPARHGAIPAAIVTDGHETASRGSSKRTLIAAFNDETQPYRRKRDTSGRRAPAHEKKCVKKTATDRGLQCLLCKHKTTYVCGECIVDDASGPTRLCIMKHRGMDSSEKTCWDLFHSADAVQSRH